MGSGKAPGYTSLEMRMKESCKEQRATDFGHKCCAGCGDAWGKYPPLGLGKFNGSGPEAGNHSSLGVGWLVRGRWPGDEELECSERAEELFPDGG